MLESAESQKEGKTVAENWEKDFIGLVTRMGDEEQTRDNTDVNQEDVFRAFHEIEPEEEKARLSEWERKVGIV